MKKLVKLALTVLGSVLLGWATNFANALVRIQCTEVSMLTARDPFGPIALYRQLVSLCGIGYGVIIVIGAALIALLWYLVYFKKHTKNNNVVSVSKIY